MNAIEQALHAILRSTHHCVAAWIYTTLLFIVVMPAILGGVLSVFGARPKQLAFGALLKFWFTWFILGPITIPFKLIKHFTKKRKKGGRKRDDQDDEDEEEE